MGGVRGLDTRLVLTVVSTICAERYQKYMHEKRHYKTKQSKDEQRNVKAKIVRLTALFGTVLLLMYIQTL